MRRTLLYCVAMNIAAALIESTVALAQMSGGPGQMPGRPGTDSIDPSGEDLTPARSTENPDVAAKKAFAAAMKSLNKAKEQEAIAAGSGDADKKAKALEKMEDLFSTALDQFTLALTNKSDMVDAWYNVGYVHLHLSAYAEAVDDYDHALALKPELMEAVEHRGEAYLALDRLDDAKSAYMELFTHAPSLADQLMLLMQKWLSAHRADAHGMRPVDVDAFGKWVIEREGIAKKTASLPQ